MYNGLGDKTVFGKNVLWSAAHASLKREPELASTARAELVFTCQPLLAASPRPVPAQLAETLQMGCSPDWGNKLQ